MAGAGVVAEALKQVSVPHILITPAKFLKWDDVSSLVILFLILSHFSVRRNDGGMDAVFLSSLHWR